MTLNLKPKFLQEVAIRERSLKHEKTIYRIQKQTIRYQEENDKIQVETQVAGELVWLAILGAFHDKARISIDCQSSTQAMDGK